MKQAFTMIELIFVIVILGILAAVALPRFMSVGQQAHMANLKSWIATLNRTVGPELWSESLKDGKNGDISDLNTTEDAIFLKKYTDIPEEIDEKSLDLTNCSYQNSYNAIGTTNKKVMGELLYVGCKDGNALTAPKFYLFKCKDVQASSGNLEENCKQIF